MTARSSSKRIGASDPGGRVSMQDVAALAGVSRSAVSLALMGHPSIPVSTRARVQAAARRLGYRKHPLVAALMTSRRNRTGKFASGTPLAFISSHVPPESWRLAVTHRLFHAMARARAMACGFQLSEFSLGDPNLRPERVRALLRARGIHGLLIAPLPGDQTRLNFDVTDFATVGLGVSVKEPPIDRVADDHFFGAQLAFERCLALGYRRIGFATAANISRRLDHRWWSGFLVAQQFVPRPARVPALMPETQEEIPLLLNSWIARHRVDAVIFSIREQAEMSLAPRHVALISLSVPDKTGKVAGIRQNAGRIGESAINLLVAKLNRWDTGADKTGALHLVRGDWSDGLSAPGAGKERRALV